MGAGESPPFLKYGIKNKKWLKNMSGAYTMAVRAALSLVYIRLMRPAVVIVDYFRKSDCVETLTKLTKIKEFVSFVSVLNRIPD